MRRLRASMGAGFPAYAGMTAMGDAVLGVGSRFRGNDGVLGVSMETGRVAPRLWRYGAEWIPAYAGMTTAHPARPQYPLPPRSRRPLPLQGEGECGACAPQWGQDSRLRGNDGKGDAVAAGRRASEKQQGRHSRRLSYGFAPQAGQSGLA